MPEGDAVYRTAKRLRAALDGRVLVRSDFRVPRHATADLRGRTVLETVSRGKHLLTRVDGGLTIHTHLRMDGEWRVSAQRSPASGNWSRGPLRGDAVRLILANAEWQAVGVKLGMVDLVRTDNEERVVGHLGPDLLGPDWDPDLAVHNLARPQDRTIGEALLDQRALAGIGTIWRAETLHGSRVSPWRTVGSIPSAELREIVVLAQQLLEKNKDRPGPMTAYGRTNRPCRRCGTPISAGDLGAQPYDRRIYWCRVCQAH
jgi:endonuclease VIII